MAYDEGLAEDLRMLLADQLDITEKKMFGSLAFLGGGAIAVAVSGRGGLMVRVDRAQRADLLRLDHVEPVIMRGRETAGFVRVLEGAFATEEGLRDWVERGLAAARAAS